MTTPHDPRDDPRHKAILQEIREKVAAVHGEADIERLEDAHPSIAAAYRAGVDVRVLNGPTGVSRIGRIAVSRSSRPTFVLVEPAWKGGRAFSVGHNEVVVARRDPTVKNDLNGWVDIATVEYHNGSDVTR